MRFASVSIALLAAIGLSLPACNFVAGLGDRWMVDAGGAPDASGMGDAAAAGENDGNVTGDVLGTADADSASDVLGFDSPTGGEAGDSAPAINAQPSLVAVGPTQACATVPTNPSAQNTVLCWGSNASGELGQDPFQVAASSTPLPVQGFVASVGSLTLAPGYACATANNWLYGWGNIPVDSHVGRAPSIHPYEASLMRLNGGALANVTTASVGAGGGCFTLTDNSLVCWGAFSPAGSGGGRDAGVISLEGGTVTLVDAFESVAVGRAHACGIATRNARRDVECWGVNDHGQAGVQFANRVSDPSPVGLESIARIQQVAVGKDDSCALLVGGTVYCWGANDRGQLGDLAGGIRDIATPTRVSLSQPATAIAVGDSHACALLNDDTVSCWGDNSAAQLGAGPMGAPSRATPSAVLRPSGRSFGLVSQIAAGGQTSCAIVLGNSHVLCWGANDFGQAGQPPSSARVVPYATEVAW